MHFGAHGTACLQSDGHVDWSTTLPYYHHHGPAGSPAIAELYGHGGFDWLVVDTEHAGKIT